MYEKMRDRAIPIYGDMCLPRHSVAKFTAYA